MATSENGDPPSVRIRAGAAGDIPALADGFRQMWLDNGVASDRIVADYRERVERFLREGIAARQLHAFVAERAGRVVGTACCQRSEPRAPAVMEPLVRRHGYIWGVYVVADERRAGLGRRLTKACVEALRAIGCTHALLHAAAPGRGVYERLGFEATHEMQLDLAPR
jgi:GNAT superfamily N-acetyltransferase